METRILGIHHVTAIAGDPQANLDFYAGVLGLRLVKLTVNFDDPGTYHLYYGDGTGRPGTILTFFPWQGVRRGRQGAGQVGVISLGIPQAALGYWIERLKERGVPFEQPVRRFDEQVLALRDGDGLLLELVAGDMPDGRPGWPAGPVPAEAAIRGVHAATLWEGNLAATAGLLTGTMGFRKVAQEGNLTRFAVGDGAPGTLVDVRHMPGSETGVVAGGTVHHIAWRAAGDAEQLAWSQRLVEAGMRVTPVQDRCYFRSIYYREPGGILFEIATDPPGFTVDEPEAELGTRLQLPAWLEPQRAALERTLPPLRV